MSTNKIIAELDAEQMGRDVPEFAPGDTVVVQVRVKEGNRERLQAFEASVSANAIGALTQRLRYARSPMALGWNEHFRSTARWWIASM